MDFKRLLGKDKNYLKLAYKVVHRYVLIALEWLKKALDGQKFKTEKTEVNFRKTQKVEVIDIWELNEDYVKYSDPTPDKAAIKRAIKAGEDVKGAKLIDDISMTVK